MRQLSSFEQFSIFDQPEPVRNIVVNRALPFTIGITAIQAPTRLSRRIRAVVVAVYFAEMLYALFRLLFVRIAARNFEKRPMLPVAGTLSSCLTRPPSV